MGTGTGDIVELCAQMGLRKPEFKQQGAGFEVTLFRKASDEHPTTNVTTPVPSDTQATLSDRKSVIIKYIKIHGKTTSSDIAKLIGVTNNWVRTIMRQMVEDGTIEKIGDNRYAYYKLKQ